jgi:hypothetical protein
MDHMRFKSNQTAAAYVADALDPAAQEAFERHLMSCPDCVSEVEDWRAIKSQLPRERLPEAESAASASSAARSPVFHWKLAASLAAVAAAGLAGGWYARSMQTPWADGGMGFYSLPPVSRGPADCVTVRLDAPTELLALRVPGAAPEQQLIAIDSEGRDLASDKYSVHTQSDGSWIVELRAQTVRDQGIRFEARSLDGTVDPRGCILNTPRE